MVIACLQRTFQSFVVCSARALKLLFFLYVQLLYKNQLKLIVNLTVHTDFNPINCSAQNYSFLIFEFQCALFVGGTPVI
jgi:hypothetical protein